MRRLAPLLLDSTPLALGKVGVFNLRTRIYKQQPQTAGVLRSFHGLDLCKHLPNHGENAAVPSSPGLKNQLQPHSPAAGEAEVANGQALHLNAQGPQGNSSQEGAGGLVLANWDPQEQSDTQL